MTDLDECGSTYNGLLPMVSFCQNLWIHNGKKFVTNGMYHSGTDMSFLESVYVEMSQGTFNSMNFLAWKLELMFLIDKEACTFC